ncbi:hypothetical protein G4O51_09200 [Candidatus Bathyarchaeota archaeon A05DMB-2]|nr:hypothetical protein [Candidatus Bathyarchaeota archaeon A05DMB-2]
MTYFNSRDMAAIAICAALWGVLNSIFSPVFFSMTHLPFFCDLIGFSVLTLAAWWVRKFGAITMIGVIATVINFAMIPTAVHFLGFTAASIFFDLTISLVGFNKPFSKKAYTIASMMPISIVSAALAGYLIGTFFMANPAGGALGWAGLHAIGGVVGGAIGTSLVTGLNARRIAVNSGYRETQPNVMRDSD